MARFQFTLAAMLALAANRASAFTIGSPSGLAAGTTGGAGGETVYPTSPSELVAYLNDTEPLVIVLNQTIDFRGTEGTTTEMGCRPGHKRACLAKNNGFNDQDVILGPGGLNNTGGCTNGTEIEVTYDNAAIKRMSVKGNKTIRGIGKSGVIMGKGLTLNGDNIIVQNIHITELNPHATTTLNKIWIDHVKVSHVGRQMVVTNKAGVATLTISNSDFDGNTEYSATCDGHHYWTFLFYGKNTGVSMLNNYVHGTSGRSPKVGGNPNEHVVVHVANNQWGNNSGHSFELGVNAYVLAEGNYFDNTKQPLDKGEDGLLYAVDDADVCSKYLGRQCAANVLVGSGNFTSRNGPAALEGSSDSEQEQTQQYTPGTAAPSGEVTQSSIHLAKVWAETTDNFGVGKLN
ncbi:pectin lyase, putative [Phytophthora infestans T30-4]|uniref:pectin lyase n=1 Tax=Phytophthora infestans (strain T30-4) TaxID=403677 RepID=D0NC25_PHYIT|nr:pectin lyase, putative [Phytophthora infestans T30-4]XP_002903115.1 pectin lyase, putative [Phytophthora infestans T30-4]EEY55539.1 pectin lyase, putative [Phytophthora infestans T30-4]EEY62061.1 pectin lyase, putative [Phytophthora infestans T30-4]|eukprot:XP_002895009.1 pectin lyase, putative [Phytophthora infestans T30-4]